jgi:site-specific recombinase XerD
MASHLPADEPSTSLTIVQPPPTAMTLEQCIGGWLHEKQGRSDSSKTYRAYKENLEQFRAILRASGLDLDGPASAIAPLAQGWAASSRRATSVSSNTYNQRLASLSSFYGYAIKHDVLASNPITRVARRTVRKLHAARPIAGPDVKHGLAQIDRNELAGLRDLALLSVALATGRRGSELAGMRYGHLHKHDNGTCTVIWPRCKGNKQMIDELPEKTTRVLYDYLYAAYGSALGALAATAPIWLSFSHHNERQAISIKTVQRICDARLGTPKSHALRHTWAVTMHKKGAKLADIGKGLGHSNLKTTSDYMEEQLGYVNVYARDLEDEFGI